MTLFLQKSSFVKGFFLCVWLTVFVFPSKTSFAQNTTAKPARILFLLDASGSMSQPWFEKETRFQAASKIIVSIMDSIQVINPDVSFGLRAFGEQYPAKDSNCTDTKLEVPFGYENQDQIAARLEWLQPRGFSPIALSLEKAAEEDFVEDNKFDYSLILITDGGETCGGDICATVQNLLSKKIGFTPYILTLVNYKPVQNEYNCLGIVLTVINDKDITSAVQKIIRENQKVLTVKGIGLKKEQHITQPYPTKPPVVIVKPAPKRQEPIISVPKKNTEPPVVVKKTMPPAIKTKQVETPKQQTFAPGIPPTPTINRIAQVESLRKANLLFALPAPKLIPISTKKTIFTLVTENEPVMTPNVVNRPLVRRKVVTKPSVPTNEGLKKVEFYTTSEDAQKTTLLVYFTNGHGKFYYTDPLMEFRDAKTGKELKEIPRAVSGNQPVPIDMIAGTYDIVIPGCESKAVNVSVVANKTNKVYIKAGLASLAFYYTTHPDSPVTAYKAYVSNRFGQRKVTIQNCDQALPYEPANYHIEINTLPKLVYNINLNFSEVKEVSIPTPGTFQIMNTSPMEQAQLWYQLGDEYVPFINMRITGNPNAQQVNLLPGFYQVRYFKSPHKPFDVSIIVPFRVKSDQTTRVTLAN